LLKDIHQQLQQEFDNGTCVQLLVTARACAIDEILAHVWKASPLAARPDVALLAVGGYGRGELHPCSDIDVLILHNLPVLPANLQEASAR
jgi:[protein-PII] uridylyltransferase